MSAVEQTPDLASSVDVGCVARIEQAYNGLVDTARRVADYVLHQPSAAVGLSITEMAERSGVSDTTVLRFVRGLGYRGYRQFALALAASVSTTRNDRALAVNVGEADDLGTVVGKVFAAEAQALAKAWQTIELRYLHDAVTALAHASRVHCYAVGGSGLIGIEAAYRFVRLGLNCVAIYDPIQIAIQASCLGPGDVAIGFSQTGRTRDTIQGLEAAQSVGATTICVTSRAHSPIVAASTIPLVLLELQAAYRGALLDSKIAELTLVDALATCIARQMPPGDAAAANRMETNIARMLDPGPAARPPRRTRRTDR